MKELHNGSRKITKIVFVLAIIIAVFFAGRLVVSLVYWNDARHIEQPLEPWMTIGYVARSYRVDRESLADTVPFAVQRGKRETLQNLSDAQKISLSELYAQIDVAIAQLRAAKP
ncbi:MAG: hypothetical protein COA52_17230 [Hyphomicrobiales bacterium]|nr:hypothetical protein [Hyphomicrobiales bacterium]PCJ84583.1 MAG: hypothetical protein COA52_17230 [Hyphomicrobiales bacterium]